MGLFAQAARELRGYRLQSFSPQSTAYWVAKLFGGGDMSASGISVTPDSAMTVATVYSSCRNIAEDLGGMPLPVYRDDATTAGTSPAASQVARKVIDRSVPAFRILNVAANPEMTAMTFRSTILGHVLLRGSGFAEKELDQALRVKALWPLNPARMRRRRNGVNGFVVADAPAGRLFYEYTLPDGSQKIFDRDLIFAPIGFSPDGVSGYSLVSVLREAIGMALGTEKFGATFFANDATPGLVMTHPKTLSDTARTNIEKSWAEAHQGLDNAHRMAILEEGLALEKVGMTSVDAQFLETRKLELAELRMALRMPPEKLQDFDRATWSNMEQSDIQYIRWTLGGHATRFEQQLAADGIVDADHYALHDFAASMRGDSTARAAFWHSLKQDGAISGEDIRRFEGFEPSGQEGADQLLIPLNMAAVASLLPNGLTRAQAAHAALEMARGGWVPADINTFLGLGDLRHTGLMPGTSNPAPGEANDEPDAGGNGSGADGGSGAGDTGANSVFSSNGHHPDLAIPAGRI